MCNNCDTNESVTVDFYVCRLINFILNKAYYDLVFFESRNVFVVKIYVTSLSVLLSLYVSLMYFGTKNKL